MNRTHLARLAGPALALLALLLGALIGLLLLAAQGILPASNLTALARIAGEVLPAVLAATLLVLIALRNPLTSLLLWLVLAPYSGDFGLDISLGSGIPDLSLTRLMAAALLLLVLARSIRQPDDPNVSLRPLTWADGAFLFFVAGMFLSAFGGRWGVLNALQATLDAYLAPLIGLYLARQLVRNRRDLDRLTGALLAVGLGLALLIVREQLTGEVLFYNATRAAAYSESIRKVQSLMGNAAPMGVTTALTLPLGLLALTRAFAARNRGQREKLLLVLLAAANGFIILGVFMTYNRTSWLGAALALLLPVLLRPQSRRLLLPVLLLAALLAGLFWSSVIASPAVSERLLEDNSISYRTESAALALDMARSSPVFGYGFGSFGYLAYEVYGWDPFKVFNTLAPSHNSYLFILVSGGLLALLPYLAWLALIALGGLRRYLRLHADPAGRDVLAAGAALLISYALAIGTFDNPQAAYMNLLFAIALGGIWGATKIDNAKTQSRHSWLASPSR